MIDIKNLLPTIYKQKIKAILSKVAFLLKGWLFKLGRINNSMDYKFEVVSIHQNLGTNKNLAKVNNLNLALQKVNGLVLKPNEIFSFWHLVGYPSQKKGYTKSRAIQNNTITAEIGGGICQLSGLIYYLALHCNFKIMERHNHSIDIYTDDERYTPLGSDATVFYGYKDLVFRNTQNVAFQFKFKIIKDELVGIVYCEKEFTPYKVNFILQKKDAIKKVVTEIGNEDEKHLVCQSIYKMYR